MVIFAPTLRDWALLDANLKILMPNTERNYSYNKFPKRNITKHKSADEFLAFIHRAQKVINFQQMQWKEIPTSAEILLFEQPHSSSPIYVIKLSNGVHQGSSSGPLDFIKPSSIATRFPKAMHLVCTMVVSKSISGKESTVSPSQCQPHSCKSYIYIYIYVFGGGMYRHP